MKKKELIRLLQNELDKGKSLSDIFKQNKTENTKEEKLASIVCMLKDSSNLAKYKKLNVFLIIIMAVLTPFTALYGYSIGLENELENPIFFCAIAVFPLIFLYGFYKMIYQFYAIYLVLSITQFPQSLKGFGDYPIADTISVLLGILIIFYVWFTKSKLFPYMGFFGPKKDSDDNYLFLRNMDKSKQLDKDNAGSV